MATSRRRVQDVMTVSPACCVAETPLQTVASMLVQHDCGAIPVVESMDTGRPVGIVTDRDITCRLVAHGKNPLDLRAVDCMTAPAVTASEHMMLEECMRLMETNRVRRIVVVNDVGAVCGIVAQADLALRADEDEVAEVVRTISDPTPTSSEVPLQTVTV